MMGFVGLSWILPTHCPNWQRQLYVLCGILLSLSLQWMGLDWDLFLYFYIAKSCFLLERKLLSATITGIVLLNVLIHYWTLPKVFQNNLAHMQTFSDAQPLWQWTLAYAASFCAAAAFVMCFSLILISEQKNRQRAEVLAQQVETLAAHLERTRIARDIHDSLGHLLTDLNARLAVAQALRDRDPDEASQAVDMARSLASQSIAEVKRSLKTIRSSDFNLNQALTNLMEQLRYNQNLRVHWDVNLPPLPLSTSHHLYCLLKEGLINIQKHSYASEVYLQCQSTPQELFLELEDNGKGFNPADLHDGFGLKGMEERVQLLGGKLTINSTPGCGTQIKITLPL
ncbi:MAG: sensor histidine kinase [Stenomitos rutilans HA7619-LM2]|nr:sensor histidine kinase [Stenomitos rutilans HA7619-LM2]